MWQWYFHPQLLWMPVCNNLHLIMPDFHSSTTVHLVQCILIWLSHQELPLLDYHQYLQNKMFIQFAQVQSWCFTFYALFTCLHVAWNNSYSKYLAQVASYIKLVQSKHATWRNWLTSQQQSHRDDKPEASCCWHMHSDVRLPSHGEVFSKKTDCVTGNVGRSGGAQRR